MKRFIFAVFGLFCAVSASGQTNQHLATVVYHYRTVVTPSDSTLLYFCDSVSTQVDPECNCDSLKFRVNFNRRTVDTNFWPEASALHSMLDHARELLSMASEGRVLLDTIFDERLTTYYYYAHHRGLQPICISTPAVYNTRDLQIGGTTSEVIPPRFEAYRLSKAKAEAMREEAIRLIEQKLGFKFSADILGNIRNLKDDSDTPAYGYALFAVDTMVAGTHLTYSKLSRYSFRTYMDTLGSPPLKMFHPVIDSANAFVNPLDLMENMEQADHDIVLIQRGYFPAGWMNDPALTHQDDISVAAHHSTVAAREDLHLTIPKLKKISAFYKGMLERERRSHPKG